MTDATLKPDLDAEVSTDLSSEQSADFAALMAQVNEAEAAAPITPGEVAPPPPVPLEEQISSMLQLLTGILRPILPSVAQIYTPEVCGAVGGAVAPVCNKHGWLQEGVGGKYGEEIMCLAVIAPLGFATYKAAQFDIAASRAKEIKPEETNGASIIEPSAPAAPTAADETGKTVRFG